MTIIIVIASLALSGCAGKEPNEIAYVVALGIDKADNYNYKITIQYANTTQISGGGSEEGGKANGEIVDNIIVEAPNLYSAVGIGNNIVSKTFSLSHVKLIVFSEEVAKEGLKNLIEDITRSEELRPDIFLSVARGEANKYLTSVKPEMDVNPAKYYQLLYDKSSSERVASAQKKDFFFSLKTRDYDVVLPVSGVIETTEEEKSGGSESGSSESGGSEDGGSESGGSESGGSQGGNAQQGGSQQEENTKSKEAPVNNSPFEYKMKNYIGGQAAVQKKNKSEVMGSAVFRDDKLITSMGAIETELFRIISGDYDYSYITFFNEETPEIPVTVKAAQEKKPVYKIDIDNKRVEIRLFIEADFYSLPADYNAESHIGDFEKNVTEEMNKTCNEFLNGFFSQYESDILKICEKSKKKFLTNDKYEEFKKNLKLREYEFDVKTDFKVRRTGLIMKEERK